MGGYDIYCSICGAQAGKPYWPQTQDPEYEDGSDSYDDTVLTEQETEWMDDLRVVGENPRSTALDKTFISGHAGHDDYGFFIVHPGHHMNFPSADELSRGDDGSVCVQVYSWNEEISFIIPIHVACYTLFEKTLERQQNASLKSLDLEVFYNTLKGFGKRGDNKNDQDNHNNVDVDADCHASNQHDIPSDETTSMSALAGFDYGTISRFQDQYWVTERGAESYVSNPIKIAALEAYYRRLPVPKHSTHGEEKYVYTRPDHPDVFSLLSTETILAIYDCLDIPSISSLRAAARSVARVKLDNVFWEARLRRDMPWLYDFPVPEKSSTRDQVDWARVYKELDRASKMNFDVKFNGLVNRHRIWTLCEKIARPYFMKKLAKEKDSFLDSPAILNTAQTTYMPRLTSFDPTNVSTGSILFVADRDELAAAAPKLSVFWNRNGVLAGFCVDRQIYSDISPGYDMVGVKDHFYTKDTVEFSVEDWITGIVVTISQAEPSNPEKATEGLEREGYFQVVGIKILFVKRTPVQFGSNYGDKRLVHILPGHVAIGVNAQWSDRGVISRLALLQSSLKQIRPVSEMLESAHLEDVGDKINTYLWKDNLPPLQLQVSDHESGYWAFEMKTDLAPMEALIFGNDEVELSNVVAIAADIQFGAFEVRYINGAAKRIGPRPIAMKVLAVAGKHGERIVAIHTCTSHITTAIRFVTNRGRQLVVGQPDPTNEKSYPVHDSSKLNGMYGYWSKRSSPQSRLDAVGVLTSFSSGLEPSLSSEAMIDSCNHFWDQQGPPLGWVDAGVLFGQSSKYNQMTRHTDQFPNPNAVVSWVNCTRKIDHIILSFCHMTKWGALPLVGLALHCTDGSREEVGPTEFNEPTDTEGKNGFPWCWCHYGFVPKQEFLKSHYTRENWQIGDRCLKTVQIWTDGNIIGLKFTAEDDGESPKYGRCEGRPSGIIYFDQSGGTTPAKGLKLYVENNQRQTTREDPIISCIQALTS